MILNTEFEDLKLVRRGKVRDVYDLGDSLLFVASDRISAFDVIMNEAIPDKGKILSEISVYWFEHTKHIIANHLITYKVEEFPEVCQKYSSVLEGRSMIVRKCKPLPVECIVRGYVAGSGWKEYRRNSTICGLPIPSGLEEFAELPEPIFTPSTKADEGHDENISFDKAVELLGSEIAKKVKNASLELYKFAKQLLSERGIILADTKFEFGTTEQGELILIDEALTPDSSRFWLKENYAPGKPQMNFDKQILRDYLESLDWNKQAPAPPLPESVIAGTLEKYRYALERITQSNG